MLLPVAETSPSASKVDMLVATTLSPATQPGEMFSGERGLAAFAELTVSIPPENVRKVGEVAWPKKLPTRFDNRSSPPAETVSRETAQNWLHKSVSRVLTAASSSSFMASNNRFFEYSVYRFAQIVP